MNVHLLVNEMCEYQNERCNDKNIDKFFLFVLQPVHFTAWKVMAARLTLQFSTLNI